MESLKEMKAAARLSLRLEGRHLSTRGTQWHHGTWIFRRGEETHLQSCFPVHVRVMWPLEFTLLNGT